MKEEVVVVFVHHCSSCELRQLIFPSQVRGAAQTPSGTELSFVCWCGAEQTWALENKVDDLVGAAS